MNLLNETMKTLTESEVGISWDYFHKFSPMINKYMPDKGEGDNQAGQICTAINKLIYKWYNDGDVFDNTYHLEGWWNDLSTYANWLYKYCVEAKPVLDRITECEDGTAYTYLLKDLADTCLQYNILEKYEELSLKDSIYECEGPFKYEEPQEEEEDWSEEDYEDESFEEEDE